MKVNIAVLIEAYNREKDISDCIKSARGLTDKIFVVDIASTDKTASLAKKAGARVFSITYTNYIEPARKFGVLKTEGDWIFILDPDERMTEELCDEIKERISREAFTYYLVPRKNYFAGKVFLKHGGWWPDYIIRLFKKEYFRDWPAQIHSTPEIDGTNSYLKNPIVHFSRNNLDEALKSTIIFEDLESELLFEAGRKAGTLIFFRKFTGELVRRLFLKLGFLDGPFGIIQSIYQAYSKTITYIFLYEKNKKSSSL